MASDAIVEDSSISGGRFSRITVRQQRTNTKTEKDQLLPNGLQETAQE